MKDEDAFLRKQEENLSIHIFSVSAAMVGVCLTVIGLFSIFISYTKISTLGDDVTSADAIIFLISCFLSYTAMKTPKKERRLIIEKAADVVFLIGLVLMGFICVFLVYILNRRFG